MPKIPYGEFDKKFTEMMDDLGGEVSEVGTTLHFLYMDLTKGGFTKTEALRIIAYGLFHQPQDNQED